MVCCRNAPALPLQNGRRYCILEELEELLLGLVEVVGVAPPHCSDRRIDVGQHELEPWCHSQNVDQHSCNDLKFLHREIFLLGMEWAQCCDGARDVRRGYIYIQMSSVNDTA